ncbi:MAG: AI-2E family transporter [Deltaproteobacteria bacterium]|nr:AI-2E family transporter [Deltaproteobacteria bacterium]
MKTENLITFALALLIGYLLYLVMAPFFIPIFWAVVLVILFYPYYRWLLGKVTGHKSLASLIACLTIALFLIIPMAIVGAALAGELLDIYQWAENYISEISARAHNSPMFVFPFLERYLGRYIDISGIDLHSIFASSIKDLASFAGQGLTGFIKSFAGFVFNLFLAFFTMYFLFKECDGVLGLVKDLLPLSESAKERVLDRNRDVISSTIYGGLLVGVVQGVLGGLAFWFLGLSAPILWASVMFLFSFLPSIGTATVWIPAAIYFFITGAYVKGVALVLWGTLVISLIDNLLRPIIVSGRTNLHPLLLFFSILGAVNVFGFIGIIAGPLILSIGQATIEIYHEYVKSTRTHG